VDFIKPSTLAHYNECEPLVTGLGYALVELNVFKRKGNWQVKAVITGKNGIGVNDCAKVHRALLTRLEVVFDSRDVYVEVASPGLDRIIKNAAEFSLFTGKTVKLWNTDITDWMQGTIVSSDDTAVLIDIGSENVSVPYSKIAKAKLV
jgi:ribosome maturation factor RimP